MVVLAAFLVAGCVASNEESLGGQTSQPAPRKEGTPDFKTYGEAMEYQTAEVAKNQAAGKGKTARKK
jgi:hypothetical protein